MVQSNLVAIDVTPLSIIEQSELQHHETEMDRNETEYLSHLQAIHDKKLYREYGTFDEYCISRRGFTANYARRILRATEVRANIESVPIGTVLPSNEAQVRPLTQLPPEEQPIAWQRAVEIAPNGKPTARVVEQVVNEMLTPTADEENDVLDPPMEPAQVVDLRPAPRINAGMFTSATPEWYTPARIIERVVGVFGHIDLDPCSNSNDPAEANVPALNYWTQVEDGIRQPWQGKVYMNPPYGDEISTWIARMLNAYENGEIAEAIALVPSRTGSGWFQPLFDYPICFVRGRLKFSGAENSAPFDSAIVYLGADTTLFNDFFQDIGRIK